MNLEKKITFHAIFAAILMAFTGIVALGPPTLASAECVENAPRLEQGVQCQTLFAGQTIDAGLVCVELIDNNLFVTYETTNGWELVETHLWVGDDLTDMPQTRKGNPKIGNFPYSSGDVTGSTFYYQKIPLGILNFSCPAEDSIYYVAAHAALRKLDPNGGYQTETGWANGDVFVERGGWGTYFDFTLTCRCDDPSEDPTTSCETAFAYRGNDATAWSDATCFLDIDEDGDSIGDFNRWGWSNGPLGAGSYELDIYAGAGQCDTSKGTKVGTLFVNYDGSSAEITYIMEEGFTMEETHLYVGNEILPRNVLGEFTVAPGQYPNIRDGLSQISSDTYRVDGLSGEIFVVAHAVVCGDYLQSLDIRYKIYGILHIPVYTFWVASLLHRKAV